MPKLRNDGFMWVWDFPMDPDQPEWQDAAKQAIHYIAHWLGMEQDDFKIECQSCEWVEDNREDCIGSSEILMNWAQYTKANLKNKHKVSTREIGLAMDGFLCGYIYRVNEVSHV